MNAKNRLVWFITGTSQGFGFELARATLKRGDSVIATSRTPEKVTASFKDSADRLLALPMDLDNAKQIAAAVEAGIKRFGRIDVLVNNAGYGLIGAVEEASDDEIAKVMGANVFGLIRVTQAVLPHLRQRRTGHIVNLSSIGGLVGFAGFGIYNATKFAVEGLSEALAAEVAPLGIGLTLIEPGPFRTDFLASSLRAAAKIIPDYETTSGQTRANSVIRNGKQQGDPVRAAEAIIAAVTAEKPPLHLILGQYAFDRATEKLDKLRKDMDTWREVTFGADFKTP